MITRADYEKLQADYTAAMAQVETLSQVNVETIHGEYKTQIEDLKAEIELLKSAEAIQATDLYKAMVTECEANKAKISELEESISALQVSKEDNNKLVNTMVMEKLASVGVAPIKVQTENKEVKKKNVYANADEYFASIK